MLDPQFMVIRVGKHREKIRAADYKPEKWPEGHEILSGVPPIPAGIVADAENTAAERASDASGASGAENTEAPASGPEIEDIDALKAKADALGVSYGANIGAPTLAKRIADAEGEAE